MASAITPSANKNVSTKSTSVPVKPTTKVEPPDPFEVDAAKKAAKQAKVAAALVSVLFDKDGHPILHKDGKAFIGIPGKAFYKNQPPKAPKDADEATAKAMSETREAWRNVARGQVLEYAITKAQVRFLNWKKQFDPKARAEAKRAKLLAELAKADAELQALETT